MIDFKLYYNNFCNFEVCNGIGIGCTLFTQICNHKCNGCFNKQTWDKQNGKILTEKEMNEIIKTLQNEYIARFTISGGDPLEQAEALSRLLYKIRDKFPNLKIWIYSGYTFEEAITDRYKAECLKLCDVLVDGRFVDELKDLTLAFRGSSNQRIIDLKKTFKSNKVVLYDLEKKG